MLKSTFICSATQCQKRTTVFDFYRISKSMKKSKNGVLVLISNALIKYSAKKLSREVCSFSLQFQFTIYYYGKVKAAET